MKEWLVRTEKNQILGPFSEVKVREMILSRKLGLQDELCLAGEYWFYLHEKKEMQKYLGMIAPESDLYDGSEITDPFLESELKARTSSPSKHQGSDVTTFVSLPQSKTRSLGSLLKSSAEGYSSVTRPSVMTDHEQAQKDQKRFQRWFKVWLGLGLGLIVVWVGLRFFLGSR